MTGVSLANLELNSIRWLIQQYQVNWNITGNTCEDITINNPDGGNLFCETVGERQSILSINIKTGSPVYHGSPDNIPALIFPNLFLFSIDSTIPPLNDSFNILSLLDNQYNDIKLENIALLNMNVTVPTNFPSNLLFLSQFVIRNSALYSDISFATLLNSTTRYLTLSDISFVTGYSLKIDSNITYQNIQTITITNVNVIEANGLLKVSQNIFPSLYYLVIEFKIPENVTVDSMALSALSVTNGLVTIEDQLNLTTIEFKTSAVSITDFSKYPNLKSLEIQACTQPLLKASGLTNLLVNNSLVPNMPDDSWFSPYFSLSLLNTRTYGHLMDFSALSPTSIVILGIQNATSQLYPSLCFVSQVYLVDTTLVDPFVPECFYCYWTELMNKLPANTPPIPAGFNCNITLESNGYNLADNYQTEISIAGNNLGYGRDTTLGLFILKTNKLFQYTINQPAGRANISFSRSRGYNFEIFWGPKLTVSFIQTQNLFTGDLLVRLYGIFNTFAPLQVSIGSQKSICPISFLSTYELNCLIPSYSTSEPQSISIDDTLTIQRLYSAPELNVTSVSSISNEGGDLMITGNFGPNPYNVSAWISFNESIPCNTTSLNATHLICSVPALQENIVHPLRIYANGYNVSREMFISKQDCISTRTGASICSGNGKCVAGRCQCLFGYGGHFCESKLMSNVIVSPNSTTPAPTMVVREGLNFTFNLVAIQELNPLDEIIQELFTKEWIHNEVVTSELTRATYQLHRPAGSMERVTAIIEHSPNQRELEFAGQKTIYSPHSIKLAVNIGSWPFQDRLNKLRVLLESKVTVDDNECDKLVVESNDNAKIDYIRMSIGSVSLYGRFLPYAEADNHTIGIVNQQVNSTSDTLLVGMVLPYCQECAIDPDFSVLMSNTDDNIDHCDSSNKMPPWKLATIITVVSAAVVSAIVTTIIIMKKKNRFKRESKIMRKRLNTVVNQ
ncbi:hypothetical protein PPL_05902 [Heterostelium album PN500]|uniref:EGF-like domain-containing protein n=1 Tax=Heterostelium pallidum (strain ATCC 26659 / Pp 5 / PN500) TaxID=670386 RepID=D3BBN3_HETP5|nr:hypothetical protein PPL_05902 [Heterostelium album PN500]EFA81066.1 hypothetical protein PPL_05902 [Heterostelium album PN500]|eukprot:XP_020433184.1 hypothetical protein PPL_05902 [Heterostelium album PN500]